MVKSKKTKNYGPSTSLQLPKKVQTSPEIDFRKSRKKTIDSVTLFRPVTTFRNQKVEEKNSRRSDCHFYGASKLPYPTPYPTPFNLLKYHNACDSFLCDFLGNINYLACSKSEDNIQYLVSGDVYQTKGAFRTVLKHTAFEFGHSYK